MAQNGASIGYIFCEFCHGQTPRNRKTKRFCKPACRKAYHDLKKREAPNPLADLSKAEQRMAAHAQDEHLIAYDMIVFARVRYGLTAARLALWAYWIGLNPRAELPIDLESDLTRVQS